MIWFWRGMARITRSNTASWAHIEACMELAYWREVREGKPPVPIVPSVSAPPHEFRSDGGPDCALCGEPHDLNDCASMATKQIACPTCGFCFNYSEYCLKLKLGLTVRCAICDSVLPLIVRPAKDTAHGA